MKELRRKIVLHGPSTLTISLPSTWTRRFNLKKGDELILNERGSSLNIETQESIEDKIKKIDLQGHEKLSKLLITASYRQGYTSTEIKYNNPEYIKKFQKIVTDEVAGFEIINSEKDSCTIQDITGHMRNESSMVLRRIWLILLDLSKESLKAIESKNKNTLKNREFIDKSIKKFTNYYLRFLIKRGHQNHKKTPLYYYVAKNLEILSDDYKTITRQILQSEESLEIINILKEINKGLENLYNSFYKYKIERIEEIFLKTNEIEKEIDNSNNRQVKKLSILNNQIKNLVPPIIEINL